MICKPAATPVHDPFSHFHEALVERGSRVSVPVAGIIPFDIALPTRTQAQLPARLVFALAEAHLTSRSLVAFGYNHFVTPPCVAQSVTDESQGTTGLTGLATATGFTVVHWFEGAVLLLLGFQ